jgi:hypothetical protein
VRALDLRSGRILRETTLAGAYALPGITSSGVMGGLSPNGAWLALAATPNHSAMKQTAFAVLDTGFEQPPRLVSLDGNFLFDGLNNSGTSLFLTQNLTDDPIDQYLVRRYDLAAGVLDPKVIVEKGEEDEPMSGARHAAVASKGGDWLYSLYLETSHGPFIHALPIDNPQFAFCIDLPTVGKEDMTRQSHWALVMSPDQWTLYAVNGSLGLVVEYSLREGVPQLVRTETLFDAPTSAGGPGAPKPDSGAAAALTPDGKMLFTLGEQGLLAIDTASSALRGRYLADWTLDGVALSPDGARLYVSSAAQGKIVRLNPATGTIAAEVPASGLPSTMVHVGPQN